MRKKSDSSSLLIGGVVMLAVVGFAASAVVMLQRDSARVYPAKFVCGIMPAATSTFGGGNSPYFGAVNPGRYTTSINIQNVQRSSAKLGKHVIMAPREPNYATVSGSATLTLPGRTATSADCPDIYTLIGESATSTRYIEGFLDVYSKSSLDVIGVYTAQSLRPDGFPHEMSTMDVEPIQPVPYLN